MRRSEINQTIQKATSFFLKHSRTLPPNPKWDITDFGLGDFKKCGLVLVNLCEEPEYCEKMMYASKNQITPAHYHKKKKEDIICQVGMLGIRIWESAVHMDSDHHFDLKINGESRQVIGGELVTLGPGERITIVPGVLHEFYPLSEECLIGEVSTENDDLNDNFFMNEKVGRFSEILEDEAPVVRLVSEGNR